MNGSIVQIVLGEWGVSRLWIWGVRRVRWESKVLEWGAKSIFLGFT